MDRHVGKLKTTFVYKVKKKLFFWSVVVKVLAVSGWSLEQNGWTQIS